jgi:hypothetical protein
MTRLFIAAAALWHLCSLPLAAQALPTGDGVIRAMHDRYAGSWYHTLTFTQTTTLRKPGDTAVVETWKEAARLPGHLRIDIQRATGPLTAFYMGDSVFVVRNDSVVRRAAARNILLVIGFDVYTQPVDTTLAELAAEHFPLAPVREDNWQGRPVYVIGAPRGDLRSRQLWIDKDRLVFVRLLQPAAGDSTKTQEIRFDDYTRVPGGWVSTQVSMYTGTALAQREQYHDVRTNPALDPGLFSLPPRR